jgi:hypothetical protein
MDELDFLRDKFREMMNEMSDHVSTGGCKSFDEYTRCCGVIEGLATAERELLDLKKRIEEA